MSFEVEIVHRVRYLLRPHHSTLFLVTDRQAGAHPLQIMMEGTGPSTTRTLLVED